MQRVLVTGGAGFIGATFVARWLRRRPDSRVVIVDALKSGALTNLRDVLPSSAVRFERADVCDGDQMAALLVDEQVDSIVHFAAESHVDRSIASAAPFVRTNVLGTHALLDAALGAWRIDGRWGGDVRFHHVSTDEVFGPSAAGESSLTEDAPYRPSSPYAASKAGADHLVRAYVRTYGLPATISHSSNNYGPRQHPEKLIPRVISRALAGAPIPVYGTGEHRRDWIHVDDHCKGIDAVLERGQPGRSYAVVGGCERRNFDVVTSVCAMIDDAIAQDARLAEAYPSCPSARGGSARGLITLVPDRPGHDFRYALSGARAAAELAFVPTIPFESGLRSTVDWYLRNPDVWQDRVPA